MYCPSWNCYLVHQTIFNKKKGKSNKGVLVHPGSVAVVLLYNIVIQAVIFSGAVLITPGNLGHVTSTVQSHWHHVSLAVRHTSEGTSAQNKPKIRGRRRKKKTLKLVGRQPMAGVLRRWLTTVARLKWANSLEMKSVGWHKQAGDATLRSSLPDWKKKSFTKRQKCCVTFKDSVQESHPIAPVVEKLRIRKPAAGEAAVLCLLSARSQILLEEILLKMILRIW